MEMKISKRYTSYKSQTSVQTCPEFSFQWFSQNYVEDFWHFEFPICNIFLEKIKFTIVAGQYNIQK